MIKDMTQGSPMQLILSFSLPILIGNIFQQLYNMADAVIVGRFVGVHALAAVGSTSSIHYMIFGFVIGITTGFSVIIARCFGAKDEKALRRYLYVSIWLCVILSVISTIITLLSIKQILIWMKTPDEIFKETYQYIFVILAGMTATISYNMISGILRALGDSKTPLYFLIIASIINVILDIFLVTVIKLGTVGVGLATVLSQICASVMCFCYMRKKYVILKLQKEDKIFSSSDAKKMLEIGFPMGMQSAITATGFMILQSTINSFGPAVVAAFTAASKVEQIATQPIMTFGMTMSTYTSQNLGAGKIDRIKLGVKKCLLISTVTAFAGGIILYLCGKYFIAIFINSTETDVMTYAVQYLRTISYFLLPLALIFLFRNVIQGLGDAFIPMSVGIIEFVARMVWAVLLVKFGGFDELCFANPITWIMAAVPLTIAYYMKIHKMYKEEKLYKEVANY